LIRRAREAAIGRIGDYSHTAPRDFGNSSVNRRIVDDDNVGSGGERRVEARADFVARVISNYDNADFRHVSLCPTGELEI